MHPFISLTLAVFLTSASVSAQNSTVECAKGLKMFVSRGTDEDMGLGVTEEVVKDITEQIDESDYEAIMYPASNNNPTYFESVGNGTELIKQAIEDYTKACPSSKMAFFGYSQGAQITSNNFCGMPPIWATQAGWDGTDIDALMELVQPLPEELTKNVISVVLFGDTTHRKDASYVYGNSTGNGMFWRANISACEALGNRIRSYCDAGDPFCSVDNYPSGTPHLRYVQSYKDEVVRYVVEQYRNGGESNSSSIKDPTATSTPSADQINAASGLHSVPTLLALMAVLGVGMMQSTECQLM